MRSARHATRYRHGSERRLLALDLPEEEVVRAGGHYAHIHDESIDVRHDEAKGETWLYGRFRYVLYRKPDPASRPS